MEVRERKVPLLRALSSQDSPSGEGIFGLAALRHPLVTPGFFQVRVHKSGDLFLERANPTQA